MPSRYDSDCSLANSSGAGPGLLALRSVCAPRRHRSGCSARSLEFLPRPPATHRRDLAALLGLDPHRHASCKPARQSCERLSVAREAGFARLRSSVVSQPQVPVKQAPAEKEPSLSTERASAATCRLAADIWAKQEAAILQGSRSSRCQARPRHSKAKPGCRKMRLAIRGAP